jgi:hypothetical protein
MAKTIPKQHIKQKGVFPYEICIPVSSEENPVQLRDTTLMLCKAYRIPSEKITVLVSEKIQEGIFRSTLIPGTYGRILSGKRIQSGFFSEGTPIVYIGSCITGFYEYDPDSIHKPAKSLLRIFKDGFAECEKTGSLIWGVQTMENKLKPKISKNLHLISRLCFGCIFSDFDTHLNPEDDVERTLLFYKKTGVVITLKMYSVKTCKKIIWNELDAKFLQEKYPNFVILNEKHGVYGISLRDMFKSKKKKNKKE